MPKPNLFVIGAMKSGTSSFHDYLSAHPEIFMSRVKEPCHFVPELKRSEGLEWYLNLFAEGTNCRYRGESSVTYTHLPNHPGVPERIEAFSPDARFIYVMRDPVARAVSHYWHRFQSNRVAERRTMEAAFRAEPIYFDYSDYAMQLAPYIDRFGVERVRAITLEEVSSDTHGVMSSVYEWLELDPAAANATQLETMRHATPIVVTKKVRWLSRFRHTGIWNKIGPWVPAPVRQLGKRISEPVAVDRTAVPVDDALEYAREQLCPRIERLQAMLGRDFPQWKTLYPAGRSNQGALSASVA